MRLGLRGGVLVDESFMTGRIARRGTSRAGDALLGGSLSVSGTIRCSGPARRRRLYTRFRRGAFFLERAQSARPQIARAADRAAN